MGTSRKLLKNGSSPPQDDAFEPPTRPAFPMRTALPAHKAVPTRPKFPVRPGFVVLALVLWAVIFPLLAAQTSGFDASLATSGEQTDIANERHSGYIFISMSVKGESFLPERSYGRADAVVLGRVTRALSLRRNPVENVKLRTTLDQPMPIVYKGYQIAVLDWYEGISGRPGAERPRVITAFCLGCGYLNEEGLTRQIVCEEPTNLAVGSIVLVPLVLNNLYGTEIAAEEYWIETGASVFVISRSGIGVRLLTTHGVAETLGVRDRYRLEELEAAVVRSGKRLLLPGDQGWSARTSDRGLFR